MKSIFKIWIFAIFLPLSALSYGQGNEKFGNFTVTAGVPVSGQFIGDNSVVWKYTNCSADTSSQAVFTTTYPDNGFKSIAMQYSANGCDITQTNEYVAPPDTSYHVTTKECHLKASYGPAPVSRILTIIQVLPDTVNPVNVIKSGDGDFTCGDWHIVAEMNGSNPASLYVRNELKNVTFSLGNDSPVMLGTPYQRLQAGSSILYDDIEGAKKVVEVTDRASQPTR